GPRGPGARADRRGRRRGPVHPRRRAGAGQRHLLPAVARGAGPRGRPELDQPAQRAHGAPDPPGPAEHLRRAGQRRRGVHLRGAGGVRGHRQPGDRSRGGAEVTALTKDPRDVVIAPVVSEKSYNLLDEGKYTFLVDPRSNKTEIKVAIEQIFGVKVASVNTINRKGK